jgi:hypothetical protein
MNYPGPSLTTDDTDAGPRRLVADRSGLIRLNPAFGNAGFHPGPPLFAKRTHARPGPNPAWEAIVQGNWGQGNFRNSFVLHSFVFLQ